MIEKENRLRKRKTGDCFVSGDKVLCKAPNRHLRQLDPPQKNERSFLEYNYKGYKYHTRFI